MQLRCPGLCYILVHTQTSHSLAIYDIGRSQYTRIKTTTRRHDVRCFKKIQIRVRSKDIDSGQKDKLTDRWDGQQKPYHYLYYMYTIWTLNTKIATFFTTAVFSNIQ